MAPTDGTASRSGVYSPDYEAAQAFDADPNSMWISAVYETPAWIAFRAQDPSRTVSRYTLHFVNGKLTEWRLVRPEAPGENDEQPADPPSADALKPGAADALRPPV